MSGSNFLLADPSELDIDVALFFDSGPFRVSLALTVRSALPSWTLPLVLAGVAGSAVLEGFLRLPGLAILDLTPLVGVWFP
jgi:hypothetical protein